MHNLLFIKDIVEKTIFISNVFSHLGNNNLCYFNVLQDFWKWKIRMKTYSTTTYNNLMVRFMLHDSFKTTFALFFMVTLKRLFCISKCCGFNKGSIYTPFIIFQMPYANSSISKCLENNGFSLFLNIVLYSQGIHYHLDKEYGLQFIHKRPQP